MTLIKSVSGIRGTIGGKPGDNLTPVDIVKFTSAFCKILKKRNAKDNLKIVVGRDARISGQSVSDIICGTLLANSVKVINIGLATTPTTEIAVTEENADGGIIITASHNPKQWNALKLLNEKGEFISATDGEELLKIAETDFDNFSFSEIDEYQKIENKDYLQKHIDLILKNKYVDVKAIKNANFKVVIDAVNSVGGIALPPLLEQLGVKETVKLNCEATGEFAHTPEPVPENLTQISDLMKEKSFDIGFAVDPDVDRLVIINEDGSMFNEEYTIVAIADYILSQNSGNTVSNLSSSRALRDVTEKHGGKYFASAVGEVNVVAQMKEVNAVFGGEGNGGVIFPELHYGRDSLIGIALFLTHLAKSGKKCSELRAKYPNYFISKNKIKLTKNTNVDALLEKVKNKFSGKENVEISVIDGVKLDFADGWVHLRKSNTEPIIRIYAESKSPEKAEEFAETVIQELK
ncbi:MAG: phosphoglucosamine mutase [Bacteroidales bacterium]|nr:phosphoglucosamine mutase [Bacteroidales bacterium]